MAQVNSNRVRESTSTTGIGPVTLNGSASGYQRFGLVMGIGDTCWYAIILPGGAWEIGIGTYTALNTLTRTTVLESSNANALVNFGPGTKDVFICQPSQYAPFEAGTLMLFQQSTAPVGWTKQITHNDKALRVVSGTAGSGGTNSFSSVMAQTTVGGTTLSISQIPNHNHNYNSPLFTNTSSGGGALFSHAYSTTSTASSGQGGGQAHDHSVKFEIQYVDLIIARKD